MVPVAGAAFPGTHPELHQASLAPWASLTVIPARTRSKAKIRAVLHYVTRSICKQGLSKFWNVFQKTAQRPLSTYKIYLSSAPLPLQPAHHLGGRHARSHRRTTKWRRHSTVKKIQGICVSVHRNILSNPSLSQPQRELLSKSP